MHTESKTKQVTENTQTDYSDFGNNETSYDFADSFNSPITQTYAKEESLTYSDSYNTTTTRSEIDNSKVYNIQLEQSSLGDISDLPTINTAPTNSVNEPDSSINPLYLLGGIIVIIFTLIFSRKSK